jgi:hypothetical protein
MINRKKNVDRHDQRKQHNIRHLPDPPPLFLIVQCTLYLQGISAFVSICMAASKSFVYLIFAQTSQQVFENH